MSKKAASTTLAAIAIIALIIGVAIGVALAPSLGVQKTVEVQVPVSPLQGELLLGAILPLTGDLASYGENSQQAVLLEIGRAHV